MLVKLIRHAGLFYLDRELVYLIMTGMPGKARENGASPTPACRYNSDLPACRYKSNALKTYCIPACRYSVYKLRVT